MDIRSLIFVALGSAIGGGLRYVSIFLIDKKPIAGEFPLSVLAVNALGSFIIGFVVPLYTRFEWGRDDPLPLFLSAGILGGFTTFSTFSLQTLRLLQSGHYELATLNAFASVLVCLVFVYIGLKSGQVVFN